MSQYYFRADLEGDLFDSFALPLWSAHQINDATAEDIKAVLMVVIFIPLIPAFLSSQRYVFAHYVLKQGGNRPWR